MTPERLTAASFAGYTPIARRFAAEHLALLQRLPLVLCPSFLQQIQGFETLFPAERELLQWQCDSLARLPKDRFAQLTAPLAAVTTSQALRSMDWVGSPARFVTEMTAHLWSSSQLDLFRRSTAELFAAIPARLEAPHRLAIVVLGQGAQIDKRPVLSKLRRRGVTLSSLDMRDTFADIATLAAAHGRTVNDPYAAWYVDGGAPRPELVRALPDNGVTVTYPGLMPIRQRVLDRVQATINTGTSGPEQMRTRLMETSALDAGAHEVTNDPVLQRFYTELFTESSGPQIFSTSFVQWTGRELARRVQPQTVLLRYAPRQRHQDMNTMFAEKAPAPDPQGSLLDAEMGAYYHWIEMNRISAAGKLTFIAWIENQPTAVILGAGAPAGTVCGTPMSLQQAVASFG